MHFRRLMFLRGPNIWSRNPVMEVWVDLGELKDLSSELIPGFTDRLMGLLPSLIEHRCSVGERGGFLQRLQRGTYMAHILEHVTLELQTLSGTVVGYGRAREMSEEGVYKVAIRYLEENTAYECLLAAREIILACVYDRPVDMKSELKRLFNVADLKCLGPSTMSILDAATARDIPWRRLNAGSLVQLGHGKNQRRIWTAETDRTGAIAETIAQDKQLTKSLLQAVGVPVPEGRAVKSPEDAWLAAQEVGLPVVVKPRDGNHARGVFPNLRKREEIESAFAEAAREGSAVLVERFILGCEHRVLVVGGKVVAAVRGDAVYVTGDGKRTVRQLVDEDINTDPRRGEDETLPLSPVELTGPSLVELKQQGYSPESILPEGVQVVVSRSDNLSRDVTDDVHPRVAQCAVLAAKTVGLDVAGLDMVLEDISQPLEAQGGAIVEVNAGPGLLMHLKPLVGKPRPVGEAILESMFAAGDRARIPIVCVTGSNGKTSVTRLIRHGLRSAGFTVGLADSRGCEAGTYIIAEGPCDDAPHARDLLLNPEIDAAVFEAGAAGILREGLGCDKCDVAVVLNLADPDHMAGEFDLYEIEKVYAVKRTPVDVVLPDGAAVLNAEDEQSLAMKELSKGDVILFARDAEHPAVIEHAAAGKRAVVEREGRVVIVRGAERIDVLPLADIPLTRRGRLAFQRANVLAAVAAWEGLKLPVEAMQTALREFSAENELPRTFAVSEREGSTLIIDQAKNAAALEAAVAGCALFPHATRVAVYSVPGDRRDEDMLRQGAILGREFDEVFLYDAAPAANRASGSVLKLLQQGITAGKRTQRVTVCNSAEDARAQATSGSSRLVYLQQLD